MKQEQLLAYLGFDLQHYRKDRKGQEKRKENKRSFFCWGQVNH
jgi:hypothetical protein